MVPAQTVSMRLQSSPTRICAIGPNSVSNRQITRSLGQTDSARSGRGWLTEKIARHWIISPNTVARHVYGSHVGELSGLRAVTEDPPSDSCLPAGLEAMVVAGLDFIFFDFTQLADNAIGGHNQYSDRYRLGVLRHAADGQRIR